MRLDLHVAIVLHDALAQRREHGAAASPTAQQRRCYWLGEKVVQFIDQKPSPTVGHIHGPTGCRNRPRFID
jgi:hypothetical protein